MLPTSAADIAECLEGPDRRLAMALKELKVAFPMGLPIAAY